MAPSTDSEDLAQARTGEPSPEGLPPSPGQAAPLAEEAARKLLREQLLVVAAAVATILVVLLVAHAMRSASAPITQKQVESKLDYLVGSSAVAAYDSLNGYPVVFMMPDDDPLGTWQAADADTDAAEASSPDASGASAGPSSSEGSSSSTDSSPASPVSYTDVTYQVQTAAHNDYALDDERYQVTGYSSPDEMTGQITVYVTERFRMYEEALSQTLPMSAVAAALQDFGAQSYPDGFELLSLQATSVEAESGTWVVRGTARAVDAGADGSSAPASSASADGWRDLEFTARVSGSADNAQVASFSPLA